MEKKLSRKERRKLEEQRVFYRNMKKNAAYLGTTVTAISAVAPLAPITAVFADEAETTIQSVHSETNDGLNETLESNPVVEDSFEEITETEETVSTEIETREDLIVGGVEDAPAVMENEFDLLDEVKTPFDLPFANPMMRASAGYVDPEAFINDVSIHAKPIADANDLYASVMIAQSIIESGWGRSTLSQAPNYNLFGIKGSYQGQTVYMSTQEYLNNQWVVKNEPFRRYPSFAESFADNAATLRNVSFQSGVYYYSGAWKSNTNSYRDATAWLTGRYATDPGYAGKLNNVIEMYNLTRFDSPATGNGGGQGNNANTGNDASNTGQEGYYTVKSGDSVWSIANSHGISMDELRSWNNLKGDLIHPGQKLVVSQSAQTTPTPEPTPTPKPTPKPEEPKPETPKPPTSGKAKTYTVKSGDSVWLISNNHGISMDELRNWNNLKGDLIHPGQTLNVSNPGGTTNPAPKPQPTPPPTNNSSNGNGNTNTGTQNQYYTVKSGDSVWSISNRHGISMADFRSWNNLKGDLIHPNQKVIVKKGTSTATPPPTTNNSNTNNNQNNGAKTTHKVVSGDSLWAIAQQYSVSVASLKSLNRLSSDTIYVGQTLKVR